MWNGFDLVEQSNARYAERLRQAEHARVLRAVQRYNRRAIEHGLWAASPVQRCVWWVARSAGTRLVALGRRLEGLDPAAAAGRMELPELRRRHPLQGYRSEIVW